MRKRFKNTFKKVLVGSKRTLKEGKEFVDVYAPKVNRTSRNLGMNIQDAFAVQVLKNNVQVDFAPPKKRKNKVDWNGLGVNF